MANELKSLDTNFLLIQKPFIKCKLKSERIHTTSVNKHAKSFKNKEIVFELPAIDIKFKVSVLKD